MSVLVLDPETSIFNVLFYILSEFYKKNAYLNIFSFLPKKKKIPQKIILYKLAL